VSRLQHRVTTSVLTTFLCAAAAWHASAQEPPVDDAEMSVIVVARDAKESDIRVDTTEKGLILRLVRQALNDLPAEYTARVTLRQFFSNHAAHYGVNAYPHTIVPLDPEGRPDGIEFTYHGDASLRSTREVPYEKGVKNGVEKIYAREGEKVYVKTEIPWKDDRIEGVRRTYHPNGKPMVETTYVAGAANGSSRIYDDEGRVTREATLKDGKRHGRVTDFWPETGKPKRVIDYDMGKVEGVARDYYADGQLKRELPFRDNAMHGIEKQYEADGTLARTRYWLAGEQVSRETFERSN